MIVRIPLDDFNCFVSPVYSATTALTANENDSLDGRFYLAPVALTELNDYNYSRYSSPAVPLNVTIPDDDIPAVASWLGNSASSLTAVSETLVKRMTSAAMGALAKYYLDTSRLGIFTRPFRAGHALRMADGSFARVSSPVLALPSSTAPLLALHEPSVSGKVLSTMTEIINTPSELRFSLPPFDKSDINGMKIASLVVFSTRQCDVLAGDETVTGIRTFEMFGEKVPVWSYSRLAEDIVRQKAAADSSFRIIAEIPADEASKGLTGLRLPAGYSDLSDWNAFPAFESDGITDGDAPSSPDRKLIATVPLHLNRPEDYKRVRGVTLRGIFDRLSDTVSFRLYGSLHRDSWHLVGTARGACMRFFRNVNYRWYRVEIEAPFHSQFDALSFEILI